MEKSVRINFAGIFFKDGDRILMMKRKSELTSGIRGIPGGHLDKNETYTQCIIREVEEELGLKIQEKNLLKHIIVHCINKKDQTIFLGRYVLCEKWAGDPINNEPDKCSKISRYHIDRIPEDTPKCTKKALIGLLDGAHYLEMEEDNI